jgi:hypothetical protein
MSIYKIIITDIIGSKDINKNTPIIIIRNIPSSFLLSTNIENIYDVNVDKLYNELEMLIQYISFFIPVGQIYFDSYTINKKGNLTFDIIMANTRIIQTTNSYNEIAQNVWVGIVRKDDKINKSIGTIYSIGKPKYTVPVFPLSYMIPYDDMKNDKNINVYKFIYSDKKYGHWILNGYKFNIDRTKLKMIDSTGDIGIMDIPETNFYSYKDNDRKLYFTAQGDIANDTNCIPSIDNLSKATLNECNGIKLSKSIYGRHGHNKKKMQLVLKENDEPWFLDSTVVGSASEDDEPHKITGYISNPPDGIIETDYGDGILDETEDTFSSPCKKSLPSGYSRAEQNDSCIIEGYDNIENTQYDYNNMIICFLSICVVILLFYKK